MTNAELKPISTLTFAMAKLAEEDFAPWLEECLQLGDRRAVLASLLHEEHPIYAQRSGAAIVRMRGWVLVQLARLGVVDSDLAFVLEELESGIHPYLVAAAARALRTYPTPQADFVAFVIQALRTNGGHDEPLCFDSYGAYATADSHCSAIGELLKTLSWLACVASESLMAIESLAKQELPRNYRREAKRILRAIHRQAQGSPADASCCGSIHWKSLLLGQPAPRDACDVRSIGFEDHAGRTLTFADLFVGRPTIVAFFYTRCDNPLKCSLTISKLARLQQLLAAHGLAEEIGTVAITYDARFDHPQRLAAYGADRGLMLDERHRMVRTTGDFAAVQRHFSLAVNFIGSLVNRHRLELFLLDDAGNTAVQFLRLQWNEQQVVQRAIDVWQTRNERETSQPAQVSTCSQKHDGTMQRRTLAQVTRMSGLLGAIGVAFFPKCPVCFAAYLSMFGVAGIPQFAYSRWMLPFLAAMIVVNLVTVGWRSLATGRSAPFWAVALGAVTILTVHLGWTGKVAAIAGIALTSVGTLFSAMDTRRTRSDSSRQPTGSAAARA